MPADLLFGHYPISDQNHWDLGNDPYYHTRPFSWGICRPNNRSLVEIGSRLFFYTFKCRAGDYYLTGMMKVQRALTQVEAANDRTLYCGRERDACPFRVRTLPSGWCNSSLEIKRAEARLLRTVARRDCRCNIIVNPQGQYKEFCDGGSHRHIFTDYLKDRIYFVSTIVDSVATRHLILVLDHLSRQTKFWQAARFHGYKLTNNQADHLEHALRQNAHVPQNGG